MYDSHRAFVRLLAKDSFHSKKPNAASARCEFCFLLFVRLHHGAYEANSPQINRRQGSEEAARNQGVTKAALLQILVST